MRIGIGQLWQETNTFNPLPTTRADFEEFGVLRGAEIVAQLAHTNELGGFIQSLSAWPEQPEIVGLVRLPAWPSGPATADTFAWLRDELLAALARAGQLDAVLLALHGALVADEHPDVEGELLTAIRQSIGDQLPLVATLDLHAHVTPAMARAADALVLFHTAPHVDVFETGQRGAKLLRRMLVDGARPVTAFQHVPVVFPAERANTERGAGLSWELKQALIALEATPGVLSAGLATVQPWLDVPDLASTVLVTTDGDARLAAEHCARIAEVVWSRREEYLPTLVPYDQAVREAFEHGPGLVVLGDGCDATTSGAPGDATAIIAELLKYDWPRPALAALVSPEVVRQLEAAGFGATVDVQLGGVRDTRFSKPLALRGTVEKLFDARFVLSGHLARNLPIDMGRAAVLRSGAGRQVRVVITSRSGPHFAPELFRAAGLEPREAAVLVAKSPCGFRAVYEPIAARIIHTSAPGCAPSDFWRYPYERITRPLWPWDEIAAWQPAPQLFSRFPPHPA
ncbi:MAG: M81 family metallopeptidase [Pirellulales bacterium]|nr:M81 family metallopeptidase [Pirellulales bacterium]